MCCFDPKIFSFLRYKTETREFPLKVVADKTVVTILSLRRVGAASSLAPSDELFASRKPLLLTGFSVCCLYLRVNKAGETWRR